MRCVVSLRPGLCEQYIAGPESALLWFQFARRMSPDLGSNELHSTVGI